MTHQNECNLSAGTIEEILRNGLEAVREMVRVQSSSVMQAERPKYLQAGEYERSAYPKGHTNGYKPICWWLFNYITPHLVIHRGLEPRTH